LLGKALGDGIEHVLCSPNALRGFLVRSNKGKTFYDRLVQLAYTPYRYEAWGEQGSHS